MPNKRAIFFISDSTGITAATLGKSLLAQFDGWEWEEYTLPYVDTPDKARAAVDQINRMERPVVFATLMDSAVRNHIASANALFLDLFGTFLTPLENELHAAASHGIGRSHDAQRNASSYERRIQAVNFAMQYDDGVATDGYSNAELILIGVSRAGKTPTSLYLAMQFGICAANYPLHSDDIADLRLPPPLQAQRARLFGLTIRPERLRQIRQQRRPNSAYASLAQCQQEVQQIEALFRREQIAFVDTTSASVEEIATRILQQTRMGKVV